MFEAFLIIAVIILVFIAIGSFWAKKSTNEAYKYNLEHRHGISQEDLIRCDSYIGGHPDIDKQIEPVHLRFENGELLICGQEYADLVTYGKIPVSAIESITVENASQIDERITLKRLILVGALAFLWKKKKTKEGAFLVITWKPRKFEHNTIFSFELVHAFQRANTCRNELIRECEKLG